MKNEQASRPLNEGQVVNRMVANISDTRGMPVNGMTQVAPASTGTATTTASTSNNTQQGSKQGS
jgi:hypothetical protein